MTGTVPATLSLTVGGPASFGAFTPGVTQRLPRRHDGQRGQHGGRGGPEASPIRAAPARLANGTFSLAQPLQARARNAANTSTAYNNVGTPAVPLNLLSYARPDVERRRLARVQAGDRSQRPPEDGHLQQDAHLHALDQAAIGA